MPRIISHRKNQQLSHGKFLAHNSKSACEENKRLLGINLHISCLTRKECGICLCYQATTQSTCSPWPPGLDVFPLAWMIRRVRPVDQMRKLRVDSHWCRYLHWTSSGAFLRAVMRAGRSRGRACMIGWQSGSAELGKSQWRSRACIWCLDTWCGERYWLLVGVRGVRGSPNRAVTRCKGV